MTSITIISIVVIVLLTAIIFGLTWLAFSACIKSYKLEVGLGKHDEDIRKQYQEKKKTGLIGYIVSGVVLTIFVGLFAVGIVYKASGDNFTINNRTSLVIKTESMSGFYDKEIALKYNNDKSLQFGVGDICVFEKVSDEGELVEGEIYGYKYKNAIITHRLEKIHADGYEFRGDNNPVSDFDATHKLVARDNVVYHYTGRKTPAIGAFILYAQSYFGIWSLVGIVGITVVSELANHQISKINEKRYKGEKL